MYLQEFADAGDLRQADILTGVPFPLLAASKVHVLGSVSEDCVDPVRIVPRTHEHRGDNEWITIQVPARYGFCAVISNCCDLESRAGRIPAHAVCLARLRPISRDIRDDPIRFASLAANKDPRDQDDPGYIDYFYLERHERLQNQDWVVHYHQLISLPTTELQFMLQRRVLQLEASARMKFKIKLAYSLGRANDEEIAAGLENPWR